MKTWQVLLYGVLIGLIGAGVILLVLGQPRGETIRLLPTGTPAPLVIHVTGAVIHPGVYELPRPSRVQDAVRAAGGLDANADPQAINLAAELEDGQRVWVPAVGEYLAASNPTHAPGSAATPSAQFPININTASLDELDALPGIGLIKAQDIITYRQSHGAFETTESIQEVPGIGATIFSEIKDLITVNSSP